MSVAETKADSARPMPEYKVVEPCFIEPHLLQPGSIIRTWGPPGPHLFPLNPSAKEQMEAWFEEEIDEIDDRGQKTGHKIKPHGKYRFGVGFTEPGEKHEVEIVSGPPKETPGGLDTSLAAAQQRRPSEETRPPPAPHAGQATDFTGSVVIAHAAERPPVGKS